MNALRLGSLAQQGEGEVQVRILVEEATDLYRLE